VLSGNSGSMSSACSYAPRASSRGRPAPQEMSVAEICQHTGKSRSGINHFIREIRAAFEEAG